MEAKNYYMHKDYETLPVAIKSLYTPKEFSWLGNELRARIIEDNCEPALEGEEYEG